MSEHTPHSHSVHLGEPDSRGRAVSPWSWIPSVYFAQGLQYSVTVQVFAIIFFTMGVSQGDTLFWTGVISFPWMIKPLWGPLVDRYGSKRGWTWLMQVTVGAAFALSAASILLGDSLFVGLPLFLVGCVLSLVLLAFAAASHDIACDGFYMLALNERKQAFFVGMRSTFFQAAMMFANGALIWLAGSIQAHTGLPAVEARIVASESRPAFAEPDRFDAVAWPAAPEPTIQIMPATLTLAPGAESYLTVRLSHAPQQDKARIVVLRLTKGDKGISIPRDATRLEFTPANWQQGIDVPVTCDPRLRGTASDVLVAQSGNIPISWSAVALLCAAIFLAVALWHRYILPRPAADGGSRSGHRPPFLVAVAYLALTVGIPFLACWGFMTGAGLLRDRLAAATVGPVKSPALQDLRELLEPKGPAPALSAASLWSAVESIRSAGLPDEASRLEATVALHKLLAAPAAALEPSTIASLADRLTSIQTNPGLYGTPDLRHVQHLLRALNGGELPSSAAAARDLLDRAAQANIDALQGEATSELAAIASVARAGAGLKGATEARLPESKAELDTILAASRTTPSRLSVKGFDSLFNVGRFALLALLATAVLRIPVLWAPIRAAVYRASNASGIGYAEVFATFFSKPGVAPLLAFLLTYRLGKSQLTQVKNLFLLDARGDGGLGLSLNQVALINSVTYLLLLTIGGLVGGFVIARVGLRRSLWPMVAMMHLPNLLYFYLSTAQPTGAVPIHLTVGLESFGNGFGFAAYLMIMMIAAQGPFKTAHYALCTGVMALGNMVPGMWAGYLQELVGYNAFFLLVMAFSLPGTLLVPFLKLESDFGATDQSTATQEST